MSSLHELIGSAVRSVSESAQQQASPSDDLTTIDIASSTSFIDEIRRSILETGSLPDSGAAPTATPAAEVAAEEAVVRSLHCCLPCSTSPEPDGVDNCCGQVAIGTVLNHFGIDCCEADLQRMNPNGIFTSPTAMTEYLNDRVGAQQHNNGSISDLRAALDAGNPVVVLINNGGEPHWITITGYELNDAGEISGFQIRDQAMSGSDGTLLMSREDFQATWSRPLAGCSSALDGATDYNNLWISTGTETSVFTRQPFSTASEDFAASAINRLVRGWNEGSFLEVYRGLTEAVWALPAVLLSGVGNYVSSAGDAMVSWGAERWNEGGFSAIIGGGSWLLGQVTRGVGAVTDFAGDCVGTVGRVVSSGVRHVGNAISSACSWIGSWF